MSRPPGAAGYSGTPLPKKLGIASGMAIDAEWSGLLFAVRKGDAG